MGNKTSSVENMMDLYGKNRTLLVKEKYDEGLSVRCHNGIFLGKKNGTVLSFKGIPFAKPPIGELRWKAPVPLPKSNKVREAYYFEASPIQTVINSERASQYVQSEDCLYLNVWTNAVNKSANKPVMVFIHGGSYGWGGTSDPLYEGTNFVEKFDDIVLVTIAYRIGIFGFLDLSYVPGGRKFPDSANLGILDQIEALKWIHNNIKAFGGNPDNVTVFGESAGGGSASLLPIIPKAHGLFKRVIIQSGTVAFTYSKKECKKLTDLLIRETGARSMKDLMALDELQLKLINGSLNIFNNFPMRDGKLIPLDPYLAYKSGAGASIDMMIGTNADECRYWINELGGLIPYSASLPLLVENYLKRMSPEDAGKAKEFIDSDLLDEEWRYTEFLNDLLFRIPSSTQALCHSSVGGNTYLYYWNQPSSSRTTKACHAVELAYIFNNYDEKIYTEGEVNEKVADLAQNMWVQFARTGNPSLPGREWQKYTRRNKTCFVFEENPHPDVDLMRERRKLIEPLLKYYINGCYTNLDFKVPYIKKVSSIVLAVLLGIGIIVGCKLFKHKS